MRERRVVDVVAGVELVVAQEAVVGEREVLDVDQVELDRGGARVLELDVPTTRERTARARTPRESGSPATRPRP